MLHGMVTISHTFIVMCGWHRIFIYAPGFMRRQIGGASAEPLSGDETDAPPPGVAGQLLATIGDFF